jgi:glutamyl-tRNA synthetase
MYIHKKMKTTFENSLTSLEELLPALENLETWSFEAVENLCNELISKMGVKTGQLLWPFRTALSGKQSTPGGAYEIADIIGREESINRVKVGIEMLKKAIQE